MDAKKDIKDYKKEWFSKVENDSKNLFEIAEDAISKDANLNVVIVKRLERFDRASKDISAIKSQLSNFANKVYDHLWLKHGSPERIHIIDLQMGCVNYPYLKNIVYGNSDNPKYDGLHWIGVGASRQFTYKKVKALSIIITQPSQSKHRPSQTRRNFRAENWAKNGGYPTHYEEDYEQVQSASSRHGGRRSDKSGYKARWTHKAHTGWWAGE